ncbi:sodium:calcium symporter [Desulfobacula phenolica]|uniref:Cation:H+ antiporter n=1 Tax=Desulfobacula phenolica TaxID=90732 RepID=A0A1H2JZK7_9BACT|nr:sodium:calcium symporter [Desulfobacula phenolica]SDU61742.1 cation:H+ antiporter [Desulfobacula phenolica]
MNDLISHAVSFLTSIKNIKGLQACVELLLTPGWWQLLLCFISCSFLMIFRLNAVEKNGFEGTLIGTLVMPYFSGFPNLCFAYLIARQGSNGAVVLENCLVNNVTTLTIVLALPSILWGLNLFHGNEQPRGEMKINHLSLLFSILAMIFFCAAVFLVSRDGKISSADGIMLMGIFFFWQLYHMFDVLKNNTRKAKTIKKRIFLDFILIAIFAWGIFSSIDNLIQWILLHGTGFFSKTNLGLLSGILMVLPNAFLAVYYAAIQRADIAYSSQIGDCHICIPLCIGLFALFSPITVPPSFEMALFIIMGASAGHFLFTAVSGKLPRFAGIILTCLYLFFIYKEII